MATGTAAPRLNTFQPGTRQPNAYFQATPVRTIAAVIRDERGQRPFRKVEIKRRQTSDGLYESSWQDVTKYVTGYGSINTALDDSRINVFVHSGLNLQVRNDHGEWNPEWDGKSIFYGYLSRNRSLVRISAGYTDGAGNQFPTDASQGIFLMEGDVGIGANNVATVPCKSLVSIFSAVRGDEVDGITSSMTASEVMEKIRDATDGSSNFLFRTFITSTSWNIQSTTAIYTGLGTTTSRAEFTVWDIMTKLAEAEGFVIHATRTGGINFVDRNPTDDEPTYTLAGAGFRKPNIISVDEYKEAVDKLYTHVRLQYSDEDTETSFVTAGTETTINVRSPEWIHGRRTYEFENTFIGSTFTAQQIASRLVGELSNLRSELTVKAKFSPHVELLDRVFVHYREGSLNSSHLWDMERWAAATTTSNVAPTLVWASETSSAIDFRAKQFKVIAKRTNLDNFVTIFNLREVEN